MTLLIAGVGALALLVSVSSQPAFWAAVTGKPQTQQYLGGDQKLSEDLLGLPSLPSDEFTTGTETQGSQSDSLDLTALLDRDEIARLERQAQFPSEVAAGGVEPVPPDLLRPVRDDIIGVHSNEAEAYFATLRLAERLNRQNAPAAPVGRYALFMDSPESCRGQAWTVTGTLRRLTRVQSDANSFGVKSLYDAWISLPDSGSQLVHVVASSLDAGLQPGDPSPKSAPEVMVTGYFFKREGYVRVGSDRQGDVALTPLILAGRLHKFVPPAPTGTTADELTPWLGWLLLLVCCGMAAIFWQFRISDRIFRRTRTHQLTMLPVRVSFDGVQAVTVSETLRQMEHSSEL